MWLKQLIKVRKVYFFVFVVNILMQADDSQVSKLSHALKTVGERWQSRMPETMDLEYFSSTNFIGLFVVNRCEALIRQITADCCEEAKKAGRWLTESVDITTLCLVTVSM